MNRERLPDTRRSITHKLTLPTTPNIYFIIGLFDDGRPGEVFITIDQEGSQLGGVYDSFGIAISMLLQSGWTVDDLARKFSHLRFEPDGFTGNKEVPQAKSIVDYLFRYLLSPSFKEEVKNNPFQERSER